jgi:hypothetical protein
MVDKVTNAHKAILKAFDARRLVELLWAKLNDYKTPVWLNNPDGTIYLYSTGKELIKAHPDYMKYKWYWRNYIEEDYKMSKAEEKQYSQYLKQKSKAVSRVVEMYPKVAMA